jgi:xylulokinase
MLFIGLDVGTGGCKASVIDEEGHVLHHEYCEYSIETPQPGYVELDARVVWQAVCGVLSAVARPDVAAIAIASFGEAVVLTGQNDEVLTSSIFYSDVRGAEEVSDIMNAIDSTEVQAVTGMPINPMYSANKLLWIRKHQPEIYLKTRRIFLFGDYIAYKLSGERVIDFSLASRTMLFDITSKAWALQVAKALEIDMGMFSEPVISGTAIGTLRQSVARELGLSASVQVVAGGHDQVMAALGAGAVYKGEAVDGMGSAECITLVLGKEDITPQMYANNYCCEPYIFEDRYVTLAFNASSGTSVKWYRDAIEEERAKEYKHRGENLYAVLEEECSRDISSVFYLPYVAGSGTPYMDASTGGAFLGLRASTRKHELYRAVLEGICFEMKMNIELLAQCGITLHNAMAVGGGSESELLMQIKADVWNREIQTLHTAQAGTTGLALVCGKAMGVFSSIDEAAKQLVHPGKTYVPRPNMVKQYEEKMNTYRRIYSTVKTLF